MTILQALKKKTKTKKKREKRKSFASMSSKVLLTPGLGRGLLLLLLLLLHQALPVLPVLPVHRPPVHFVRTRTQRQKLTVICERGVISLKLFPPFIVNT